MDRQHDLELIPRSRTPFVAIETRDESRLLEFMSEKIGSLRLWAAGRTVPGD